MNLINIQYYIYIYFDKDAITFCLRHVRRHIFYLCNGNLKREKYFFIRSMNEIAARIHRIGNIFVFFFIYVQYLFQLKHISKEFI